MKSYVIIIMILIMISAMLFAEEATSQKLYNRIESREATNLIGLDLPDFMLSEGMMPLWEKFLKMESSIPDVISKQEFGVSYYTENYDPKTMKGMNYFVGCAVKSLDKIPEGMLSHIIPAGNYVVFEHKGPISKIGETYELIYGKALNDTEFKCLKSDIIEIYDERFKGDSDDSILEIWVPIEKPGR